MSKAKYQHDYAAKRPQMYSRLSRKQKADRMVKLLEGYFGTKKLKELTLLDVGASTGIIDNVLARSFKTVVGIDIDKDAVDFAKKSFKRNNLQFKVVNAMELTFKDKTFDVAVCAHVYEHVPDAKRLISEIYRVLKPTGVCYLAAINRLWPWEPHYNLPFLSWFPKRLADYYVQFFGKEKGYYETPKTYWGLKKLTKKFKTVEYTQKILQNPKMFGYNDRIKGILIPIAWILSPLAKYLSPTFFWLLIKEEK